jgi:prepilin-type N-terminal cleavage/methylation domain-containing protein/prepilin-type processing-associated H-X9-DG protein
MNVNMEDSIMKNRIRNRSTQAFTLVELLVVISIIALLLAVLMPALQKAKQQAESVICKTRLSDIGKALSLYAIDQGDAVPPCGLSKAEASAKISTNEGIWLRRLAKYYGLLKGKKPSLSEFTSFKLLRCPTQDKWKKFLEDNATRVSEGIANDGSACPYSMYRGCYALNFHFQLEADNCGVSPTTATKAMTFRKYSQIKQPGGFPLVADVSGDDAPKNYTGDPKAVSCSILFPQKGPHPIATKYGTDIRTTYLRGPAPVHSGKTNYLMGDLHSETKGVWPWKPPVSDFIDPDWHPRRKQAGESGYEP